MHTLLYIHKWAFTGLCQPGSAKSFRGIDLFFLECENDAKSTFFSDRSEPQAQDPKITTYKVKSVLMIHRNNIH